MRNFSTNLVSAVAAAICAAGLSKYANAQLPRECFFMTEMHGLSDEGDLMSDLPTLMAMYKPGM